ncbi:dihydrolipoyl dehydrogenase [uncultured Oscillibacter sp.]|uniref:dihydrolipoyl dehydrogenase n=1 Tax=uncultured Oscillibacter sp. TaxID=876091 RepID=UPI00262705B0|nr:dihydrolipoyl dehydrogenase [uncultured Oscillibacter sp.]
MKKFDVIVLGGGPAGYTAAMESGRLGKKTALIEDQALGGTCLNRGCIPTKALLESSGLFHQIQGAADFGIHVSAACCDFQAIQARKERCVEQLRSGVAGLMRSNHVEVFQGYGEVKSAGEIRVNEESLFCKDLILATGSKPTAPPIPGLEHPKVVDSTGFLAMERLPSSAAVIGGGVIGVEFATFLAELGCAVTVLECADSILPMADQDLIRAAAASLEAKGAAVLCGAQVQAVEPDGTVVYRHGGRTERLRAGQVIAAIGRGPNTDEAVLNALGLRHDRGRIETDRHMRTSVPHVYACGDANGKHMLAHAASHEGLTAARNIAGIPAEMDYRAVPSCVYLHPQLAWVGLTEREARGKGLEIKTGRFPLRFNGKALVSGDTEGFVKIVAGAQYGEVLGVHIMAANAAEMIGSAVLGLEMEVTLSELQSLVLPHPTVSESIGEAAANALR